MSQYRIYRYSELDTLGTPYKHILLKRGSCDGCEDGEQHEASSYDYRLDESVSRSRRLLTDLILCNRFSYFCTFTFDGERVGDRRDYQALKSRLLKFFNNYRQRVDPTFRYVAVPERHKDGSIHFHGVVSGFPLGELVQPPTIPKRVDGVLKRVPNTPGYLDWPRYSSKFGFFSCSRIRDTYRCALYCCKYLTKDFSSWIGKGQQVVLHSKGLARPELVFCEQAKGEFLGVPVQYDGEFCKIGMGTALETSPKFVHWTDLCAQVVSPWLDWSQVFQGPNWEQIYMEGG